jgi:hypothetical protein
VHGFVHSFSPRQRELYVCKIEVIGCGLIVVRNALAMHVAFSCLILRLIEDVPGSSPFVFLVEFPVFDGFSVCHLVFGAYTALGY